MRGHMAKSKNRSESKSDNGKSLRKLKFNKHFRPCLASPGDEIFANGIFEFNITQLLKYVHENLNTFPPVEIPIATLPDFPNALSTW